MYFHREVQFLEFSRQQQLENRTNFKQIVRYINRLQDDENHYLIFEIAENGSLDKLLATKKTHSLNELAPDYTRFILGKLVLGVKSLHGRNIVHRDLKPGQVLINEDLSVTICDFGFVKWFDPPLNRQLVE